MKTVQIYNLAKLTGVEVLDRFKLILEIFARRATTTEAKLQIQLARLRYELPRAKEKVRMAKLSEQPGFLGLGRYEVDLYYETIQRQITNLHDKLENIRGKRQLHRAHRLELGYPQISLAGYTNAGKSSLFNTLAGEMVAVNPALFTTLSTTTRTVDLLGKSVLLTDTVGFIDRLSMTLIEAFHSTLEETIFSELLLLIVDLSEPLNEIKRKLLCCHDTIQKIGASGIPIITVLNKIDLLSKTDMQNKIEFLKDVAPNPVPVSALYKSNIFLLKQEIKKHLKNYIQASLVLPITDESLSFLSWLHKRTDVQRVQYKDDTMEVVFESIPWFAEKVKGYIEKIGGNLSS